MSSWEGMQDYGPSHALSLTGDGKDTVTAERQGSPSY